MNAEILRFNRAGYIQPAWSCNVRISSCLSLLNQTLLATIFREDSAVIHFINWAKEAYHLNREKRDHYIL
ncbi:MAG: hypothetical protein KDC71_18440, partial [Acidobacteria bacterium]|nr:hypothetical protein [Acidobacteriota bacterium]